MLLSEDKNIYLIKLCLIVKGIWLFKGDGNLSIYIGKGFAYILIHHNFLFLIINKTEFYL